MGQRELDPVRNTCCCSAQDHTQQQMYIVAYQALHSHGAQMKAKHQLRMPANLAELQTLSGIVTCQCGAATTLRVVAQTPRPLTAPEYPSCKVGWPPR
jgi:hypothetical protein